MTDRPLQPLRGASQFQNVFSQPDSRQHAKDVFVLAKRNDGQAHRIGLITSKKKLRRAVDRNRFRRVAREVLRGHPSAEGLDVIFMVKHAPAELHTAGLYHQLNDQLTRLVAKLK